MLSCSERPDTRAGSHQIRRRPADEQEAVDSFQRGEDTPILAGHDVAVADRRKGNCRKVESGFEVVEFFF